MYTNKIIQHNWHQVSNDDDTPAEGLFSTKVLQVLVSEETGAIVAQISKTGDGFYTVSKLNKEKTYLSVAGTFISLDHAKTKIELDLLTE